MSNATVRLRDIPKSRGAVLAAVSTLGPMAAAGVALSKVTAGGNPAALWIAVTVVGLGFGLANLYHLDRELREVPA